MTGCQKQRSDLYYYIYTVRLQQKLYDVGYIYIYRKEEIFFITKSRYGEYRMSSFAAPAKSHPRKEYIEYNTNDQRRP